MNLKIILKYLIIAVSLVGISVFLAYQNWWKLDLYSGAAFLMFLFVGIAWFGILYLGILISRIINFKNDNYGFIGLLDFEKVQNEINFQTFKNTFSIMSFLILGLLIFTFLKITESVERRDLMYFGNEKIVKIDSISTCKISKLAHFSFDFNGNRYSKILPLTDTLKNKGDYDTIIFSSKNPYISEWKKEFENK